VDFKKSARKEAQESEPHHIGKHTIETLNQNIFSLENTKPMFREKKWNSKLNEIKEAVKARISKNQDSDVCQYLLKSLERIENQR